MKGPACRGGPPGSESDVKGETAEPSNLVTPCTRCSGVDTCVREYVCLNISFTHSACQEELKKSTLLAQQWKKKVSVKDMKLGNTGITH